MDTSQISFNQIVERIKGVLTLNTATFSEISRDRNALTEAIIVVAAVAVSAGIGRLYDGAPGLIGGIFLSLLGWVIAAGLIYWVGSRLTGTPNTTGTLEGVLRTMGYAAAPNLFSFLGVIWLFGGIVLFVLSIWSLITTILGIRASLGMSTGRAVATGLLAMIASWIVIGLLGWIFGINPQVPF